MARRILRTNQNPGFVSSEYNLAPNEVLVVPVRRSVSKNGDSTIAIMAKAGTKVSYTIEHQDQLAMAMHAVDPKVLRPYLSSEAGDYPAVANPDGWARVWKTDQDFATDDIYEHKAHATALRIIAPAGGTWVLLLGDY
jgi:hypothetical protein